MGNTDREVGHPETCIFRPIVGPKKVARFTFANGGMIFVHSTKASDPGGPLAFLGVGQDNG